MNEYKVPEGCVLILRTCDADMTSYGDFRWPESGPVECPDWDPRPVCRHGLRGLLWGAGDGSLLRWYDTAIWIVAEVDASQIVDLGGKIKAPRANVIYAGDRQTATELIARHAPSGTVIVGHTASAGYGGTASVGYYGTASAGDYGTASAGDYGSASAGDYGSASAGDRGTASAGDSGTASAGEYGTATAGDNGTASAGYRGSATAGEYGTATAGDNGTASAGYGGTASVGYYGTASAGDYGTASAGDYGTASAGDGGTATAGDGGTIMIRYIDGRLRVRVGYIGEDGLLPNVKYRLDGNAKFVLAAGFAVAGE